MTIICELVVVLCVGGSKGCVNMMDKGSLEGKVIAESELKYVADFSADAKKKKYVGDYSERLIDKTDCVELK